MLYAYAIPHMQATMQAAWRVLHMQCLHINLVFLFEIVELCSCKVELF